MLPEVIWPIFTKRVPLEATLAAFFSFHTLSNNNNNNKVRDAQIFEVRWSEWPFSLLG